MEKYFQKMFVPVTALILIAMIGGCKEQNLSGTKKTRLIAAENIQLRKDLAQRDKEIEEQKELLAKCKQEKKQGQKAFIDLSTTASQNFEKIAELGKENKNLKEQIENLKKQTQGPGPNTPDKNSVK